MRVEWTERAEADALEIAEYIHVNAHAVARAIYNEIHRQVAMLADFPRMGRPGRVPGTRELVVSGTPYIAAYRVEAHDDAVLILRVLHGTRRWPREF
ncbi:MAG: type II toxin-antitoxin system RelE/ParE family toxin [Thermoanaerobaculia bacterium]